MAIHLNKLQSSSPKNALCQIWLKLSQWFWRICRRFSNLSTYFCCSILEFSLIYTTVYQWNEFFMHDHTCLDGSPILHQIVGNQLGYFLDLWSQGGGWDFIQSFISFNQHINVRAVNQSIPKGTRHLLIYKTYKIGQDLCTKYTIKMHINKHFSVYKYQWIV